jgi:topoisomerase-4 subunit A
MSVEAQQPLLSAAAFGSTLRVLGSGRGGKPKDELLGPTVLTHHAGKRARKGHKLAGWVKPQRVSAPKE